MKWGSIVEIETRRRIQVALWAYAYEVENDSIVDDGTFDREAALINLNVRTQRPDLDFWFVLHFDPCTGCWIYQHPEFTRIKQIYERHFKWNRTLRVEKDASITQ